jgi:hypothetical protein
MLEDKFKTVSPIEEFIHQKLLAMFFVYLIVGGMPDAVKTYIETKDRPMYILKERIIRKNDKKN